MTDLENYTSEGYEVKVLKKILGAKDFEWYERGCPIPMDAGRDTWKRLETVRAKINKALKSRELKIHEFKTEYTKNLPGIVRDELTGGMFCPADGKTYNSKAAYYKAVKAKGLEIVGNERIEPKTPKLNQINWERAVAETLQGRR